MQSLGLRVFYDKDHHAHLWGKSRTEYEKIYGADSVYVVPMISKHYAQREWTQWEFETAKREARKREGDFLLPIRLDESRQFGLTDDHNYIGADDFTPEEIANALKQKLDAEFGRKTKSKRSSDIGAAVLATATREALGLIVTAPVPVPVGYLKRLFPNVAWPKHLRRLRQLNLIDDKTLVNASKHVHPNFTDELDMLESRWVTRLEKLQDHVDCALFLSLIYVKHGRIDDAILLAADTILETASDHWLPLYTTIFEALNRNDKLIRRLHPETRMEFFRAFGYSLSASRRFEEARVQFEKLRSTATRRKDMESVGLALLNNGTNYHKQGDTELARKFYERTRDHATKHELTGLASNAIGNLAQIEVGVNPNRAIELLHESIELKKKCGDRIGIAGSTQVLAQAFAELGDFDSAIRHYDRAEAFARKLEIPHLHTLVLFNKGNTLFADGKRSEALRAFKKAQKMAGAGGYTELHVRAIEGTTRALYSMGKLSEALLRTEELLELAKEAGLVEYVMTAHHGLWAASTRLGDYDSGSRHFQALTRLARKEKSKDWLIRGLIDKSRPIHNGDFEGADPKALKRLILREARRHDRSVTSALWVELARICVPDKISEGIDALRKCISCCEGEKELIEQLLYAYEFLYTLQWDFAGRFADAIETLDTLAAVAKKEGNVEKELAAIDQKGVCLQELKQCSEALEIHKSVADRARKQELDWLAVNSLHNLAECHRRLEGTSAALRVFDTARQLARDLGDETSVLEIDHGRALTLKDAERLDEASALFKDCRDRSRRMKLWSEYVRALEAIATLSWTRGKKKTAVKQYEKALSECDTRDVVKRKAHIALNLSRLLRHLGDLHKARKILAKHIDLVDDLLVKSDFHSTLAELCEETRRLDEARENWKAAIDVAESIGDQDKLAYCRSRYAEFERTCGDSRNTIRELDELLKGELSSEDRGTVLVQLFKALVERKSEKRAELVFDTAQDHLQKNQQNIKLIDLHMAAFDHNWIGNRNSRFTALQAYVVAFLTAFANPDCEEHLGDISGHVMLKLTRRETAPSLTQLKWLSSQLENWLTEQSIDAELIQYLLKPIQYSEKLIPFKDEPIKFLKKHEELFEEFMEE